MKDTNGSDDWRTLCELASKEHNPQKLLDLVTRINRALDESHRQFQRNQAAMQIDTVLPRVRASQTDLDFCSFPSQPSQDLEYDC